MGYLLTEAMPCRHVAQALGCPLGQKMPVWGRDNKDDKKCMACERGARVCAPACMRFFFSQGRARARLSFKPLRPCVCGTVQSFQCPRRALRTGGCDWRDLQQLASAHRLEALAADAQPGAHNVLRRAPGAARQHQHHSPAHRAAGLGLSPTVAPGPFQQFEVRLGLGWHTVCGAVQFVCTVRYGTHHWNLQKTGFRGPLNFGAQDAHSSRFSSARSASSWPSYLRAARRRPDAIALLKATRRGGAQAQARECERQSACWPGQASFTHANSEPKTKKPAKAAAATRQGSKHVLHSCSSPVRSVGRLP